MTKRKNKRFKRIFAIFSLVLVLAFTFIPFGASAITTANDYGLDFSALPNANFGITPSALNSNFSRDFALTSSNSASGSFTFTATSTVSADTSAVLSVPFKKLVPYLDVGQTVYISWEVEEGAYRNMFQFLKGDKYGDFYSCGTPLYLTEDIMNSYVCFYPFVVGTPKGSTVTYSHFRVNTGSVKDFAPYEYTKNFADYCNGVYIKGFNDSYDTHIDDYINQNYIITRPNFSMGAGFQTIWTVNGQEKIESVDLSGYPWTGYAMHTEHLSDSAFSKPSNDAVFRGYFLFLYTQVKGSNMFFEDLPLIIRTSERNGITPDTRVLLRVMIDDGTKTGKIVRKTFDLVSSNGHSLTIPWTTLLWTDEATGGSYAITSDMRCMAISIETYTLASYNHSSPYNIHVICSADNGYNEGYKDGYGVGEKEGYFEGEHNGHTNGYLQGNEVGYTNGMNEGYNKGYKEGNEVGYATGYNKGSFDSNTGEPWLKVFSAAVSAPVNAVTGLFNFEVLGIDMRSFIGSALLVCTVVALIKFFIK